MKSSEVEPAPARDVRHLNRLYDLCSSRIIKLERDIESTNRRRSKNVSCQCNIRRDLSCTCRRLASPERRYFSSPKQVYRLDWQSFTEIGVGSIKVLPRKRTRKIYLPETIDRAAGSADLTSYINRRSRQQRTGSYYENKRTSSKCVQMFVKNDNVSSVNKQLSPIIQKKSETTSPKSEILRDQVININNYDLQKRKSSISTQVNTNELNTKSEHKAKSEISKIKGDQNSNHTLQDETTRTVLPTVAEKFKSVVVNDNNVRGKDYLSDSTVHVHNLENTSDDKQSKMLADPMEDKLEREYRKIFTSKSKERLSVDKTMIELKNASLLRRRFEALRRGLGKKESKKESILIKKNTSQSSMPNHKDVSIALNPPSLERRSDFNTKVHSPYQSTTTECKQQNKISPKKFQKGKKNKEDSQLSPVLGDRKYESVQGMFKLWGKKFNLDEENNCETTPTISHDVTENPEQLCKSESPPQVELMKKKQGRKFFLFGKKTKDKENKLYKPKKGVTTGKCEVKDGLTIKMGGAIEYSIKESVQNQVKHLENVDNKRKAWLDKYITNTTDSRNSVHIRWNNKMYATSSSTVVGLMDSVYKHIGKHFRSRSEVTTGEFSNYHSYTKQRAYFMQQHIEAWMIPKLIANKQQKQSINYRTSQNNNKYRGWFVDATNGFSQKIELVLQSNSNTKSSEYVIINVPEGYFSHSSSNLKPQSSDEKIYKIVEYDTSELKRIKQTRHMATGDNFMIDTKVNDSAQNDNDQRGKTVTNSETGPENIQKQSLLRDVAIQGSDVYVPKRCDVIEVGIITQRDRRDVRKPVLKIEDKLSEGESEDNQSICQKKCELVESYLQDYCRNWMTSGIDMISWRISDSQHSENNFKASLSQGDGNKSYPNLYQNFQQSTIILSSCETSSCSHCIALEDEKKPDNSFKRKFLSKFRKKPSEISLISDKRNCPKDSLEVYKRRQFYACNNQKCKWYMDENESYSLPSIQCKAKTPDGQTLNKPCWKIRDEDKKKQINEKRVSLPGCDAMSRLVDKLSERSLEGILTYKGSACNKKGCHSPKRTEVLPSPICEIPQPPCKETCLKDKKPPCVKNKSPPCNELLQPRINLKTPIPCEINPLSPSQSSLCIKTVKKPPCSACYKPPCRMCNENFEQKCLGTNTTSQQSVLSISTSARATAKQSDVCFQTNPNNLKTNKKECKPNCANKRKWINRLINTPPAPPPSAYHMPLTPDSINTSKDKVTGLYLKKFPSKKRTYSDERSYNNHTEIFRLHSQDKFTIQMKKEKLSTEEVRESLNIKVQDEDGQTLYERIDYKQSGDVNKCFLLEDVYKDPQIQRVSTPITVHDVTALNKSQNEIRERKSNASVDNLIEINFILKLKQGDKGGDMKVQQKNEGKVTESQKSIYVKQNRDELPVPVVSGNKKDVNIKIVIKSYNTDPEKCNETEMDAEHNTGNDGFNKRISEKFQTVSTGYSDIDQHAFSVHRATVDLTSSVDEYEVHSKFRECVTSNEFINVPKKLISSRQSVAEHSITNKIVNSIKYKNEQEMSITSSKKNPGTERFNDNKSEKYPITDFKNHTADTVDETSNESVLHKKIKLHNGAQKKMMFKKVFRSSSSVKKPEDKKKIKEIIHAILTSDSSESEMAVTSNELPKELTYAYLDQGYFKDTNSLNNHHRFGSEISNFEESRYQKLNPTKNCGCCCQENVTKDDEINRNVGTNECLSNVKAYMDVETQNSKHVLNKLNSANMRSETQSVVKANTSVTLQNSIDQIPPIKRKFSQTYFPDFNNVKYYGMKRLNRQTLFGLSDDEMIVLNSNIVQKSVSKYKRKKISKYNDGNKVAADVLQLNETKKAVLEIYKEKIASNEGKHLIAKLPKFHMGKVNDISNYEDIMTGRKKVSKRNFVMMAIDR